MRYFIRLCFDGTAYHGWQVQKNAHSVQAELNKALSVLFQKEVDTLGCGRTDTGVHARKFYAHFDGEIMEGQSADVIHHLNCMLPHDISVQELISLHPEAHARFDAISRTYEYQIYSYKDPFLRRTAAYFPHELNVDIMNSLSEILLEHSDFSSFSKSRTQTLTNICTITEAYWVKNGDLMTFKITANRFLRNMVRAIVGTLLEGGLGRMDHSKFKEILESKTRSEAGPSVPARGLSLVDIRYPYL